MAVSCANVSATSFSRQLILCQIFTVKHRRVRTGGRMDAIQFSLSPLVGPKLGWVRCVEATVLTETRTMTFSNVRAESSTSQLSNERGPKHKPAKKKASRRWKANASAEVDAGAGLTYKGAGVDIDAGSELVRRIAALTPGIGGFGGLFPSGESYTVAGTDGVGTKLKLAVEMDVHDTIGIDLVAMSVNDIVTSGAKPLYFLSYFSTSHLDVDQAEQVIKGIVDGCRQSDSVLIGAEISEMPDVLPEGEYELAGTAVGSVKKNALIDGQSIQVGDQIIGLASSGVHSNGFSLVRRVLAKSGASLQDPLPGADGISIGEALLAPTVIYVKQVLELIAKGGVKGIAHITGGGFTDNIPRIFPPGLGAFVNVGAWDVLPIFKWLQKAGSVQTAEMFRTFNMGIGMILVVAPDAASKILSASPNASILGYVVEGDGVTYSPPPSFVTPKLESFSSQPVDERGLRRMPEKKSMSSRMANGDAEVEAGDGLTYKDAGVDVDRGSELARRIAALSPGIGGFCGLFPFGDSYSVGVNRGVGTKLKVAIGLGVHDTIGIDLVAMSVNDIITSGAKPLFFLDYFATSHLDVDQAEQVIKGMVDGCRQSDCVLLGGETAEMPDVYADGEYELCGSAVGSVKKDALVDGKSIIVGDQIIALASSGVHCNGFSQVWRILAGSGASLQDTLPGADGISIGEALLAPTVIYVKQVLELVAKGGVKGIAHIKGGGLTNNIPQILPPGLGAFVNVGAWNVLPIFQWLQEAGGVQTAEMFRTFNMGIGMVLVVAPDTANEILSAHPNASLVGSVVEGDGVTYGRSFR